MYSSEFNLPENFTLNQWSLMGKLITLLNPFEEVTRQLSKNEATVSEVIPTIYVLCRFLSAEKAADAGVMTTKNELLQSVKSRFAYAEKNELCVIATVLDPRFKNRCFLTTETDQFCTDLVLSQDNLPYMESSEIEQVPTKKQKCSDSELWNCIDELSASTSQSCDSLEGEYKQYICEPLIGRSEDVRVWWHNNKHRFPKLSILANKFLSTPPSSVASERLFSTTGKIATSLRSRLKPDKIEELAFIKGNSIIWNFEC